MVEPPRDKWRLPATSSDVATHTHAWVLASSLAAAAAAPAPATPPAAPPGAPHLGGGCSDHFAARDDAAAPLQLHHAQRGQGGATCGKAAQRITPPPPAAPGAAAALGPTALPASSDLLLPGCPAAAIPPSTPLYQRATRTPRGGAGWGPAQGCCGLGRCRPSRGRPAGSAAPGAAEQRPALAAPVTWQAIATDSQPIRLGGLGRRQRHVWRAGQA